MIYNGTKTKTRCCNNSTTHNPTTNRSTQHCNHSATHDATPNCSTLYCATQHCTNSSPPHNATPNRSPKPTSINNLLAGSRPFSF